MSDEPESITLRLRWRPTWPDKESDYAAEALGYDGSVGRIYLHDTGGNMQGHWFWAMNAHGADISRNIGDLSGYEPSPRQAARRVEQAWFAAIRGGKLADVPAATEPPVNAYAAAKGR